MENETRPDMTYAEVEPQDMQLLGTPTQLASLFGALSSAQGAFKPVHKNREVTIRTDKGPYTFAYAELSQSLDATRDALASNGLAVSQPFSLRGGVAIVRTILSHKEGGLMISTCELQRANAMKDLGGLLTYCRRYAFNALLSLAADEDLDDQPEASRGETGAQSGPRSAPKAEEPRRAPQTPQTQAKPAARVEGPKAQAGSSTAATTSAPAGTPKATGGSLSGSGSGASPANSAPAGEPPKAQTGAPSSTQPSSAPSPSTPHSNETSSQPSAAPSGTPLTKEQQGEVYAMYAKLDIAPPRIGGHLTALMGRLGLSGKVTQETHGRVMDALRAELPAGGA